MCSLFSPLPTPDAASRGTKNFGMVSAERREDCHCIIPFLEWGSYHVHPQREDASVIQQHCSRCSERAEQPKGFLLHPQQQWPRRLVRLPRVLGQPRRSESCVPWQGESVGGDGAAARWWQGTCLHIPPGAGSLPADEVR